VSQGQLQDTAGRLLASAAQGVFCCKLSRTSMPTDLLVQVTGLTDGWTAAKQTNSGSLSAVTVQRGTAYTTIDLNPSDVSLVVGHPVTATDPRLRIVTWWTKPGLEVWVHNPTEEDITYSLRCNAVFKGMPVGEKQVSVAAGASVPLTW
jgi:hypothetical protein